jgi:CMP-N-acetylneuraminic acid synthetase
MKIEIVNKIQKDLVYAIIPARSGSKGIPDKNIRLLGSYPMIAYSIIAARYARGINRVIVSTDSRKYADIAIRYGAEVPVMRPPELAQDLSNDLQFMEHIIDWLYDHEQLVPEFFVHLRPTTPLRQVNIIEQAIQAMKVDSMASSLRSGHASQFTPQKWFWKNENGYFTCIAGDMNPDDANSPRQIFPKTYIPDGYVDVLRTEYIIKNNRLHGDRVIGFEVPESVDIDFKEEIEQLEELIKESNSDTYRYLKDNYKPEILA